MQYLNMQLPESHKNNHSETEVVLIYLEMKRVRPLRLEYKVSP